MSINHQRGNILVIVALVAVGILIASGGTIAVFKMTELKIASEETSDAVSTVASSTPQESFPKSAEKSQNATSVPVGQSTIANCGTVAATDSEVKGKKVINCFEEKLKNCEPAVLVFPMAFSLGTEQYQIIGPNNGLCSVEHKILTLKTDPKTDAPNQGVPPVGKSMICGLNNIKTWESLYNFFSQSNGTLQNLQQNYAGCSGSLYDYVFKKLSRACNLRTSDSKLELRKSDVFDGSKFVRAYDWRGSADQVYWRIKNEQIAIAVPDYNGAAEIRSVNIGKTELEVTDTAVGNDCSITIPVTVTN